ncbi:MAG TPA: DUF2894 domain-containing protein [Polyangia bacterium]|jgi:hypothetical protein
MTDASARIEALRARGAARFDPVGWRFLEALARRAAGQGTEARRALDRRLAQAVAAYAERFERAAREASDALARGTARAPGGGGGPLAELLAHLARHAPEGATGGPAAAAGATGGPTGELRSVRCFRRTWSRLSVDQQLSHALAHAPENAGPLNSHALVLRSLRQMRAVSPDYLEQLLSYVEALRWLDEAERGRGPERRGARRR